MSFLKNLPNLISISRVAASLALLFTTVFSLPFWILYILCGISDMIDGALARRLKAESKAGAATDSIADLIFITVAAIKIIPKISIPSWLWWVIRILAIAQIVRMIFLYCKERRCSAFHDIPNRVIGVVLFFVPFILGVITVHANPATYEQKPYGLCIITESDSITAVNGESFYPMYSVVKFPQALYVADRLNRLGISLDSTVFVQKNLLMQDTWSPMLERMGETADISIRGLLHLSLVESDNNACNLLFRHCGKPELVDAYLKENGFRYIQVAVTESQMHDDPSLCEKNCCTPEEMACSLLWFSKHKDDTEELRAVWDMMAACRTGIDRIPAAVSADCKVIHKNGTGPSAGGAIPPMNDAGIVIYPDGTVQAVAVFVPEPDSSSQLAEIVKQQP